ncbi:MAG: CoA transferase [Deltaproteobacteria bacterium]|nr:MAG: CoA transferase [Deltaproteobacteria bacterium]
MKPLDGIRVIDASRIVSGPVCAWLLASLGAEVIRVEAPGGDHTWQAPPWIGPTGVHRGARGERDLGLSPLRRGRGKRSAVLDLKTAAGFDVFRRLLAASDVLVENFVPGALARIGLDDAALEQLNPRLVYCSITGYGHDGPYANRSSLDLVVQAMSGLMAKTGFADGPPTKVGATVGDQVPAIYAALGVVAALRQRDRDGRGQKVDVAMLDALVSLLWDEPLDEYARQGVPERVGNTDPRGAPLDVFRTADGWAAVVVTSQQQWERLCEVIGRPELVARYAKLGDRVRDRTAVNDAVAQWCAGRTTDEVVAGFLAIEVPVAPVQGAFAAPGDPQVKHRGALVPLLHPDRAEPSGYVGPAFPVRLSRADTRTAPAEPLGASTESVLREVLGLGDPELAALRAERAFG